MALAATLKHVCRGSPLTKAPLLLHVRLASNAAAPSMAANNSRQGGKREGDISDSFASLSGKHVDPLPDRFRQLKLQLANGYEDRIITSWKRLLATLERENEEIIAQGSQIIPEVRFAKLSDDLAAKKGEIKKRGVAIVKGVIPEDEARAYKFEIEEYVRQNPQTTGFPRDNPQVIELYWSSPQLRARVHPAMLRTQKALMTSLWHVSDPNARVSLHSPLSYADRLRIRQPGDSQFALGPHQDGGSVERWEHDGYGRGGVYDAVFRGDWESYDPFDASGRVDAETNLYDGLGASSMFRMFQGWLSMSWTGPGEGTLLVNPLARESTAYMLLRPFFRPLQTEADLGSRQRYLAPDNWQFTSGDKMTSELQGATPGHGQELSEELHPHLQLDNTMIHIPKVGPGDFVVWHCDTIHSVDKTHHGASDSSVLYIPVCPTTEASANYVSRQRAAFLDGTPAPDFPGGKGESDHIGRPTPDQVKRHSHPMGVQSVGLGPLFAVDGDTAGGKEAIRGANSILGF